jgi:predicted nucleic acid-binding protein
MKFDSALDLISRLNEDRIGALSTQVLIEFYNAATRKLRMPVEEAEAGIRDLSGWLIHRPAHSDILSAIRLQRRYNLSWWDALVINSGIETGASIFWSEDLKHGQEFGRMTVRNPFFPQ